MNTDTSNIVTKHDTVNGDRNLVNYFRCKTATWQFIYSYLPRMFRKLGPPTYFLKISYDRRDRVTVSVMLLTGSTQLGLFYSVPRSA